MKRREFLKRAGIFVAGCCVANSLEAAPKGFVCNRCGKCCLELCEKNIWIEQLDWQEKQDLFKERAKYQSYEKGCLMVVFEGKKAVCLVHRVFGYDKKPKECRDYPIDGKCLK